MGHVSILSKKDSPETIAISDGLKMPITLANFNKCSYYFNIMYIEANIIDNV